MSARLRPSLIYPALTAMARFFAQRFQKFNRRLDGPGAPGSGIVITVRDTGTGISKSDLERLGKPFEQVENAQTRAKEGTGLGLALVKSLAQMHGGVAAIESVLGEGTTVTVRLPHAAVDNKGERLATGKVLPFKAVS